MSARLRPIADPRAAATLAAFTARLRAMRGLGHAEPAFMAQMRERARAAKLEYLGDLARWLPLLCERFEQAGGQVHLASDAAEARGVIEGIMARAGVARVVKSKSMLGEEIDLNPALEAMGIEVSETDLGEFIIQLAGERAFHILGPAMHKDRRQIARLFAEKLGLDVSDDPEALTQAARRVLRERFLAADAGISGVNVAACETGTLALITNEGNGRYCTTLPRVHVALMGFEKGVPTLDDLALLATYIPRAGLGARLPSYVSIMNSAPKSGGAGEAGPRERHLVILDNGRSEILAGPHREMLLCLRCATCLNFCPVYGLAGGHAYPGAYSGPMGAVLGQLLGGQGGGPDLSRACSQCGRCRQMCPMGIDLPAMQLALRQGREDGPLGLAAAQAAGLAGSLAAQALTRRRLFDAGGAAARGLLKLLAAWEPRPLPPGPWKRWRRGRHLPLPLPPETPGRDQGGGRG